MFIRRLNISDLLSFGPGGCELALEPLNVFIGVNGSGKSNLIDCIDLLRSLPTDLPGMVRRAGGIQDLLHDRGPQARPTVKAEFAAAGKSDLNYKLVLTPLQHRTQVEDERLERVERAGEKPHLLFGYEHGRPVLGSGASRKELTPDQVSREQSILAQRKDQDSYPELTWLGEQLAQIRIFRNWQFGRSSPFRQPQPADAPSDFLAEDFKNLALVLNDLSLRPRVKSVMTLKISNFTQRYHDWRIQVSGNQVQFYLQDFESSTPAHRLSDGTLRYLCLLAVLLHPTPPPLICIEEPELGLHPDALPAIAELLTEAATRTQLIVTTHSDILVDALSATPESVVVTEMRDARTLFRRQNGEQLSGWLREYGLGQLWLKGEIGGTLHENLR